MMIQYKAQESCDSKKKLLLGNQSKIAKLADIHYLDLGSLTSDLNCHVFLYDRIITW